MAIEQRAPLKFKKLHPDEWEVVENSIKIQQKREGKDDKIDFAAINVLVISYIKRKGNRLPADARQRIAAIDSICSRNFAINGYDDSNFGMHIADGTRRLFEDYVGWLYEKEARRRPQGIALDKEFKLMSALNDAMYNVCDSVTMHFEGSGGWMAGSDIHDIEISYRQDLCKAIVGVEIEKRKTMHVPLGVFDKECGLLAASYSPIPGTQPIDPTSVVDRFKNAFHTWYQYRQRFASQITDVELKKKYEAITYGYARLHLLHLKNRFRDIGMMGSWIETVVIKGDCSNKELFEYSYEESYKQHL